MLICNSDSMNKYSTKRTSNSSFDSYSKHRRDYSPNRRSHSRNSSPDSWSPRGSSSYSSKSYSRRSKERDRDSKYYDGCSKSKYMRLSRSPVGHEPTTAKSYKSTSGYSRDPYYENNHSSFNSIKKSHFGDWTEQISSSGKRYFYNSKTEVSQWDKPKDWEDWEKRHSSNSKYSTSSSDKYSNNFRDKYNNDTNSTNSKSYAYSNNDSFSSREKSKDIHSTRHGSPSYRSHNSKTRESEKRTRSEVKKAKCDAPNDYSYKSVDSLSSPLKSSDSQCMLMNNNHSTNSDHHMESPKPRHPSTNNNPAKTSDYVNSVNSANVPLDSNSTSTLVSTLTSLMASGQSSSLSKLLSQLKNSQGINLSNSPPEDALLFLKKALNLSQKSHSINNNQIHNQNSKAPQHSPRNSSSVSHPAANSPSSQSKHHSNANKSHSLSTYRHLNSTDPSRHESDSASKNLIHSPTSSSHEPKSTLSSNRNNESVTSSLSTISSVISSSATQKSTVVDFSKFKHLYKESLIDHVVGWYSEQLEKQATSYGEQSTHIGNNLCTRVSAELKNSRSLVRLKEIQATLQKQKNFFEIQQIKTLEDWRGKQSSNVS